MELINEIKKLKESKNAVVLAHYYQPEDIQDIADHVGDSFYLSKIAQKSDKNFIVFCGVEFMAESAKILSPKKRVFIGNQESNCTMVDDFDIEELKELIDKHPDAAVVSYINSSTEIKTLSYTCCTSSSAVDIVNNIKNKKIIFVPDKNLGSYTAEQCPDKEIIIGSGGCSVHDQVQVEDILNLKERHPKALVLVHPECNKKVRDAADFIGSTGQILKYAEDTDHKEFIIGTEEGIRYALGENCPDKKFYFPEMICKGMKKTTLEDVYNCLDKEVNEIILEEEVIRKASKALDNMIALAEKR